MGDAKICCSAELFLSCDRLPPARESCIEGIECWELTFMQTKAQQQAFHLLIVVPVYNHAHTLSQVLTDLSREPWSILVVNDGSHDGVASIAASWPGVNWENHPQNLGKGAALATGMRFAAAHNYTHILTFDADGQHKAIDIPSLVDAARREPQALIIGARDFVSQASGDVPGSSKFGRKFSNFWIWVESGVWLDDTQTGLRIYPVDLELLSTVRGRRYAFEVEVLTRAIWQRRPVRSVLASVYYPPRAQRISHFRPWFDNAQLSLTHTRLCFFRFMQAFGLHRPLRLAAPRAEMKGAEFTSWVIRKAGAGVAYSLMIFPLLSAYLMRGPERRAISDFYSRVHPSWGAWRCRMSAFVNYWYFAASIIDRLREHSHKLIEVDSSIDLPPPGSILVGAHYGDWFLIARKAAQATGGRMGLVIDAQKTPAFFHELARQWEGRLLLLKPSADQFSFALSVKELLDEGGRVCFMIDRLPLEERERGKSKRPGGGSRLEVEFFSASVAFLRAPFALAKRLKVPLYFAYAIKKGPGVNQPYVVRGLEIWNGRGEMSEEDLAKRTALILQEQVQRAPQHWFNFLPFWKVETGA